MPTAIRFSASIPVSNAASDKSDYNQYIAVALFSAIGLFVSLVAVMCGAQGVWY